MGGIRDRFLLNEPSRMDETWVTPKSLLNYREIPVVRAWDRRAVIGCYSAAVNCIWKGIFPLKKTWASCSQCVVCIFHCRTLVFCIVFHSSNPLFSFINNRCLSYIYIYINVKCGWFWTRNKSREVLLGTAGCHV